jgi:hypothetical protein
VSRISKSAEGNEVKRLNINVPVELHNNFKSVSAARGENMTDVLLQFIEQYVDKHSPKPKRRRK